ncbi:hypothetical protein CYMTET_19014, partial [Cymbomonas tetramitiformis]
KGRTGGTTVYELMERMDRASDRQRAMAQAAERVMEYYCKREWQDALRVFEVAEAEEGQDPALRHIRSMCEELDRNPPPDDWHPVVKINEKSTSMAAGAKITSIISISSSLRESSSAFFSMKPGAAGVGERDMTISEASGVPWRCPVVRRRTGLGEAEWIAKREGDDGGVGERAGSDGGEGVLASMEAEKLLGEYCPITWCGC